ncbi:g5520 [Coccomyxa viridis]|uniref:Very-long-chain (3R)-3-hydroxyacyl-CoA dehydratase n=1 Tax=Coccomyxa viridis TaxID=1274662 RepID=A0ABP1FZP9_9CHLO
MSPKSTEKKVGGKEIYLAAYNVAQLAGWASAAYLTIHGATHSSRGDAVYSSAGRVVRLCQCAAILETVHTAVGLTRGSVVLSFLQWFGRSNVLFLILQSIPELWSHWAVPVLFTAWSLADIARYPWYAWAQFRTPPHWLTWLRYSAFIPLYPLGILGGEMPLIWTGLPYMRQRKLHSTEMPNSMNFAFSYPIFAQAGLFVLLPLAFVQLYTYMLKQRSKRLAKERKTS